jgi:hypothetical protein
MTTNALTLAEWNNSKFRSIPIIQTALDLISKSETLKGDIRAYQSSNADDVKLLTVAKEVDSGSYAPPTATLGGLLSVGINRVTKRWAPQLPMHGQTPALPVAKPVTKPPAISQKVWQNSMKSTPGKRSLSLSSSRPLQRAAS